MNKSKPVWMFGWKYKEPHINSQQSLAHKCSSVHISWRHQFSTELWTKQQSQRQKGLLTALISPSPWWPWALTHLAGMCLKVCECEQPDCLCKLRSLLRFYAMVILTNTYHQRLYWFVFVMVAIQKHGPLRFQKCDTPAVSVIEGVLNFNRGACFCDNFWYFGL